MPEFKTVMEDDTSSDEESEGNNENNHASDSEHVSETSFAHENVDEFKINPKPSCNTVISEDPFGIYKILKRNKDANVTEGDTHTPQYPPGFTPNVEENVVDNIPGNTSQPKPNPTTSGNKEKASSVNDKFQASGSILEVMDELIKDPRLFVKDNSIVLDSFLAISGDFNEVRFEHERRGSLFNSHGANSFNNFITRTGLIDLPLEGYSFTWAHKSTSTMSKLDRFLIFEGLLALFPSISALFLDKHFLDHRPILLHELNVDYGPTPFQFFHSWSSRKGFDKMVEDSWKNSIYGDWIVEPSLVKNEFLKHFATRFAAPSLGSFPPGCNSSFITLIPKSQEAKMVKEFCPISLIGSMYKIITKVLANHLSLVISELIDEYLNLSHLFYADDVIFVGKWNSSNLSTIVNILKWFYLASGLKINLNKSKLMGIGISHDVVASAAKSIGCSILHTPFNYLGVKVGGITSRLSSWDDAIANYPLDFLNGSSNPSRLVPNGVLSKMESIRRNFFNGVENAKKKMSLIGWNKILASKKNGAIYGIRGALDNTSSYSRRSPWLDIVNEVRKLASKGIDLLSLVKKKVGNGEATSFWNDVWLGDFPLKQTYPRLYFLELDKHVSVASNDRWSWLLDPSGDFSVKSTREFIDDSMLPKTDVPTRWVKSIPIKINIFAWRVSLDKLPTRLNLSLRGLDIPSIICPLCSIAVESTSHILFSCQLARQLMIKVVLWWDLEYQDFHSYEDWLLWFKNLRVSKRLNDVFEGVCYISCLMEQGSVPLPITKEAILRLNNRFTKEAVLRLNNGLLTFEQARALFNVDLSTFKARLVQLNIFMSNEVNRPATKPIEYVRSMIEADLRLSSGCYKLTYNLPPNGDVWVKTDRD
ncbi:RNA-directed DNA polymerase, eukaryota [Tanacetum coccineum]